MLRKKNDIFLKAAIEETFMFLLGFMFTEADKIFDYSRGFTFMDKELRELFPELQKKGGTRNADMLVKVYLLDGSEQWILVHLEIQGTNHNDFPKRMFRYYYRIYDRFGVGVTAIAVFTGKSKPKETQFTEHLLGTELTYKYNTYHILNHTEAELLAMNNPFALVVLAAQKALMADKLPEEELNKSRLTIARALVEGGKFSHPQVEGFLFFLKSFLHIDNNELNTNFDQQSELLTGKTNAMGIIETIKMLEREEGIELGIDLGIEQGTERTKTTFVKNLIEAKRFTVAEIANFASVSEAFVHKIIKELK